MHGNLDLLMPSAQKYVQQKSQSIIDRTINRGIRVFQPGDNVQVRNYGVGNKWKTGCIVEVLGKHYYLIDCYGVGIVKRHVDQIISHYDEDATPHTPIKKSAVKIDMQDTVPLPISPESAAHSDTTIPTDISKTAAAEKSCSNSTEAVVQDPSTNNHTGTSISIPDSDDTQPDIVNNSNQPVSQMPAAEQSINSDPPTIRRSERNKRQTDFYQAGY